MNPLKDRNEKYFEVLRTLDGARRLKIAFELHELTLKLSQASLQQNVPSLTREEASRELYKRLNHASGRTPVARS